MKDNLGLPEWSISKPDAPSDELDSIRDAAGFVSLSRTSSSAVFWRLARLPDRFVKLLAILATLSFRIIELADARTGCSLRLRPVIPGYGRNSRVQTSDRMVSRRIRSARVGASTGMRLVVTRDCDLLID